MTMLKYIVASIPSLVIYHVSSLYCLRLLTSSYFLFSAKFFSQFDLILILVGFDLVWTKQIVLLQWIKNQKKKKSWCHHQIIHRIVLSIIHSCNYQVQLQQEEQERHLRKYINRITQCIFKKMLYVIFEEWSHIPQLNIICI